MNHASEFYPHAGLARHPKLVAAAIGLAMLLFASAAQAEDRGSSKNPILLPGTETTLPRVVPPARDRRVVLHHGAFEATLYSLPTLGLSPDMRPHLSTDTRPAGAEARA